LDSTTIDRSDSYIVANPTELKGKKIGVVKEYMDEGLDPAVRGLIEGSIEALKAAGAEISEVSLPTLPLALAVYYILVPAEVSSNLSRYDGQRYGFTAKDVASLDQSFKKSRSQGFGKEAKRRIMIGTYVLSSGYYDAYYKRAQTVRTKLVNEFAAAFEEFDFLVGPTAPSIAFKIGENTDDPLKMYLTDIMTVGSNLVGNPAISIPAGTIDGMPVGLQLLAAQKNDKELLAMALAAEKVVA
jgi:aspartyl-tRNA(Asn)/glutamyl-tRNA(Gln) amidotransferase subunit A